MKSKAVQFVEKFANFLEKNAEGLAAVKECYRHFSFTAYRGLRSEIYFGSSQQAIDDFGLKMSDAWSTDDGTTYDSYGAIIKNIKYKVIQDTKKEI